MKTEKILNLIDSVSVLAYTANSTDDDWVARERTQNELEYLMKTLRKEIKKRTKAKQSVQLPAPQPK